MNISPIRAIRGPLALASKYPPGRNGNTGKPWGNLVNGGDSLADASDRTQTLWNMLDYTRTLLIERTIDLSDPALDNVDYTTLDPLKLDPARTPRMDGMHTYSVPDLREFTR